eukprot:TRINITY_DN8250_c0_g1_i1.p1 TRINITY_DN8250_c0_g1~~TRINITY_DN8250_c0_g1_i1.p1  ORF type:complete len:280 (-),score=99.89 TRINITY_DN8250_c0_g1_i1:201-947(-)
MTIHGIYVHSLCIEENAKRIESNQPISSDSSTPPPFQIYLQHRFTRSLPFESVLAQKIVEKVSSCHLSLHFYSQFHSQKNKEKDLESLNDPRISHNESVASNRDSMRKVKKNAKYNEEGCFTFDPHVSFSSNSNEELDSLIFDREEKSGGSDSLTVVWKQVSQNLFYSLLCDESENLLNASRFLHSFPKMLAEHFGKQDVTNNPNELLTRVDDVIVLLNSYLPNGLLLFANSGVDKNLKKEAASLLVL